MTTRREFLKKSSQVVAAGAMFSLLPSCNNEQKESKILHKLPSLPYKFDALMPHIDAETMEIHHGKHHNGYVNKLNSALEKFPDWQKRNIADLLRNLSSVPSEVRESVQNNGGGHYNHSLFWESMRPEDKRKKKPEGKLKESMDKKFGSFQNFQNQFFTTSKGVFGSGWGWLVALEDGSLEVMSTENQDNPISMGFTPLLGIDVWEHAYYLKYQNERGSYITSWWNLVDWAVVEERFSKI